MPMEDQIEELQQEHRDLLTVLRAAINGTTPPVAPTDWIAVLNLARFHQVDMFLYPSAARWPQELQPDPDLMNRWRNAYFAAVVKYERAAVQLKEILHALHDAAVPVIPLKGAWLAEKVYDEGAQRPMCDFDLLIPLDQLDRARAAFEELGYTTPDHYIDTARDKDIRFHHSGWPLMIELHFRIWNAVKTNVVEPDNARLWIGVQKEILHGIPILSFPPERQIVYLVQHILHHSLKIPLKAYIDLILLSRKQTFDPDLLETEARALGVPFGAPFLLQVAMDIWGEAPPESLTAFLLPNAHHKERATALTAILLMTAASAGITPALEATQQASAIHRIRLGLSQIFLAPHLIRNRYSQSVELFGLAGGYIARANDLVRRRGKNFKNPAQISDLENFASRRSLSQWIHEKNKDQKARFQE